MAGRISRLLIALFFAGAGVAHFVVPGRYVPIVPHVFPAPLVLVYVSGFFEILGGVGLLVARVRRAAGVGLALLLVAVFPANVQMLADAVRVNDPLWWRIFLVIRLPLQAALIYWILRVTNNVTTSRQPAATASTS
ncbi:MAG: hypothetical protein ABJD07_08765 [Gemmatimonadaceae bacterium]